MRAKNRMREICTSGSVRGGDGNILAYSARRLDDDAGLAMRLVESSEPREGVRLDDAGVGAEPGLGMGAGAVRRVEVGRGRRVRAAEGTIVAYRRPEPASARLPAGKNRDRRVVEVDAVARPNMRLDQANQGRQRRRHRPDPIRQRRHIDWNTFTAEPLALPMQRQVQAELPEHHFGQELRSGAAAADRMEGRRLLRDRLAGAAREALAHVLDDAPARRDPLERLSDVLAELAQRRPAAAGASLRCGMHDAVPRQVLRQGTAGGLASCEGRNLDRLVGLRRGGFTGRFLEILETEFELLDAGAALRRWPEPLAPQPGDLELQPFDLDAERQLRGRACGLGRLPRLALRQDHRMGGGEVGRQRIRGVRHLPRRSYSRADVMPYPQPTAVGRQLSLGMRQSMPDSR